MGSHPCKLLMDTILNDKNFNIQAFIKSGLGEFINQLISYFNTFNKKQESSFFKRAKFVNSKKVLESLKKIFGSPTITHLDGDKNFMTNLNLIFCTLLHPESPAECRAGALDVFLIMIVLVNQKDLQYFQKSLSMMIPYAIVARGSDVNDFKEKIYKDINPIYVENPKPVTSDQAKASLSTVLTFVFKNWTTQGSFVQSILMNNILKVIYRASIEKAGVPTQDYGFSYNPEIFHEEIVQFIQKLLNSEMDISPLFANRDSITAIFAVAEATTTQAVISGLCTSCILISTVYSNTTYYNACYSSKDFNKNTGKLIFNILAANCKKDGSMEQALITASYDPIKKYLETVLQEFQLAQTYFRSIFQINDENHGVFAHFICCILRFLVDSNEKRPEVWSFFIKEFCQRKIGAAACSYFLQYLVVLGLPSLFDFDTTKSRSLASQFIQRNKRNRQESCYDFIGENLEQIIEIPHEFTRKVLKQEWAPFSDFDEIISNIFIQPLEISPDKVLPIINFIVPFFNFIKLDDEQLSLLMFIPLYQMSETLARCSLFPPGIKIQSQVPYQICGNFLFQAIFDQPYSEIRTAAFSALAKVLNLKEIQKYLGQKNLSSWYAALMLQMTNENIDIRSKAFFEAQSTVQDAFTGSSYLIPLMMALLEEGLVDRSQQTMSFLSSFPLFRIEPKVNKNFLDGIIKVIKSNKKQFVANAETLLNKTGANLRSRAIVLLKKIDDEIKNCRERLELLEFVDPAFNALLADELSRDKNEIDSKLVEDILKRFIHYMAIKRTESICSIRTSMMYMQMMIDNYPQIVNNYVKEISNLCIKLTEKDDVEWSFQAIRLTTDLYVETGRLIKVSDFYKDFALFLRNGITKESQFSQDIKDVMSNSLELLSKNYMRYPLPLTPNFLTSLASVNNTKPSYNIFRCMNTSRRSLTTENKVQISTQFPSGQFVWEFTPVNQSIVKEMKCSEVKSSSLFTKEERVPEPYLFKDQKSFSDKVDTIIDSFKIEKMDLFPDGHDLNETLNKIIAMPNDYKQMEKAKLGKLTPPEINMNTPAAILNSVHLMSPDNFDKSRLYTNDTRSNDFLDKANVHSTRLGTKFGVIYVKDSSEDQNAILGCTLPDVSEHFKEFVTGLGWPINLQKHPGYLGGLDAKNEKNGRTSIYYADFAHEEMFHVGPLLPNDPSDKQQIYKKRHIGNDHIHICWCDAAKDYNTATISSQFNQAHIVIYPLQNALFGVKIKWRDDVPWFGPLRCDLVVNKLALPSLVRETAEGAMLAIYFKQSTFSHPLSDIKKVMDNLNDQCQEKDKKNPHIVFTTLLQPIKETDN
ncbi:GTPase activator protein [Trichomonas vaginalis G3]|nr:GTPase activator protein [Trichomonas vaginalis G3]KAI5519214.1 GTPase activator protein [Trichomonas vaginalis G3]